MPTASQIEALLPQTQCRQCGYDGCAPYAQAIAQGGASALAVHARTKIEGYCPPAHWEQIAPIRQALSIPVIANGDVFSLADYLAIRQTSGCQHVMLGRGAVITPDLARQIQCHNQGLPPQPAGFADYLGWIRRFFQLCREHAGDTPYPAARLKQWLGMMKTAHPQAAHLFTQLRPLTCLQQIEQLLDNYQPQPE